MTHKETLRYLATEMAGATLSDAEWTQVEAQSEGLQAGLKALDALALDAAEPAVEFGFSEEFPMARRPHQEP